MSIRERIKEWKLPLPTPATMSAVPEAMRVALKEVQWQFSNIQPKQPSTINLVHLFHLIEKHFTLRNSIEGLNPKEIRRIPWIIFTHPEDSPGRLATDENFCDSLLKWLQKQLKPSCISTLLFVFLREYPTRLKTFHIYRNGLRTCLSQSPSLRIQLAKNRCENYHLLAENGPKQFAKIILEGKLPPNEMLQNAGLTGQLETQGFSIAAYREVLKRIYQELSSGNQQADLLNNLFSFATVESENKLRLRFDAGAKSLADALLLPYAHNKAHSEHQKVIQSFLVNMMGDPRIVKSRWVNVDKRAKEVIFGWLVEATLDVFFRILDKTADKIWRYRKAFWSAYYKNGYIRDAWAVLGKNAVSITKQINDRKIRFGQLIGGYANNQSVLLLRIGDLIIAEWSHNGKCRIWRDTEENQNIIPKLYDTEFYYNASSLRRIADFEQVHHASDYGTWQTKVERYIRRQTNIKLFHKDYMP